MKGSCCSSYDKCKTVRRFDKKESLVFENEDICDKCEECEPKYNLAYPFLQLNVKRLLGFDVYDWIRKNYIKYQEFSEFQMW